MHFGTDKGDLIVHQLWETIDKNTLKRLEIGVPFKCHFKGPNKTKNIYKGLQVNLCSLYIMWFFTHSI